MGMADFGEFTRTIIIPPHRPNLILVSHGTGENIDLASFNPNVGRAIVKVFDISHVPVGGYNYSSDGWVAGYGLRNSVGLVFDGNNLQVPCSALKERGYGAR